MTLDARVGQGGALGSALLVERDTGRCSSAVERVLGKDEVTGSSPVIGSSFWSFGWIVSAEESDDIHRESY